MSEFANLLGRVVAGKFAIEEHVGSGAMGDVFRGRHVVLDTVIALKIMRPDIAKDPMFKERFYREAKAASRLDHPNSVRVIDFGVEPDGLVYLAMEFLSGRDLLTVLREEWPLPDERVVDILVQTLGAVSVAHELGIVHRDLKPENIMISVGHDDDGARPYHVKVCDFGIAKLNEPRGFQTEGTGKALTTSGTLIGTPEYMSPEQARGDTLDARSDLYSLGVVLYQLLVGKVPFSAENALGVVLKQVTDEPVPPSKVRPGVNARLEAICLRALKKPREERYQTAKEMRRDMRAVFGSRPQSITEESNPNIPAVMASADLSNAATIVGPDMSGSSGSGVGSAPGQSGNTLVSPHAVAASGGGASSATSAKNLDVDFTPKQTSDGTELTVPVIASHRYLGAIAVGVVALLVGGGGVFVFGRTKTPDATTAAGSASNAAGNGSSVGAQGTATTEPATADPAAQPLAVGSGGLKPRSSTTRPLTTPPTSTRPGLTSATASGTRPAASTSAVTAATAPATAAGPPYDPASAHVSLGMVQQQRVREDVIRRKMGEALPRLSSCYRDALIMGGAPVGGSAEIHMSIDDAGNMTTIVNAPKLPSFARCAQMVFAGQKVPVSALEGAGSGGANATQWLTLQP